MNPRTRPAEWATALTALVVAVIMFLGNRDLVALVAVIAAVVPAIITAIASRVPALARLRPTEVATALAGLIAAFVLFNGNHDAAALTAALTAFLPTIVTIAVEVGEPASSP